MAWRFRLARRPYLPGSIVTFFVTSTSLNAFDPAPVLRHPSSATLLNLVQTRAIAEAAERSKLWEMALEHYLQLYLSDGPNAELRDKIRHCSRHAKQLHRHRDPAFRHFVLTLPAADALNLYSDALDKLTYLYVDKDRATLPKLFALGVEELDRAFDIPAFIPGGIHPTKVREFRESLRTFWAKQQPLTPKDARQLARDLATAAIEQAPVTNPSCVILELLCGACSGLDEFTTFRTPRSAQPEGATPEAMLEEYGVFVRVTADGWVVEGVSPNSWAAFNTNIRQGSRIYFVDPDRTLSPFNLLIEIDSPDEMEPPELVNLPVPAPTAFVADIVTIDQDIGYIRIVGFRGDTPSELDDQILLLKRRGMRGLILDLRDNPGGNFPAAVSSAERFLSSGVISTTQGQSPEFAGRTFAAKVNPIRWTHPIAVLADTRTMSAAEVLASSLKAAGSNGQILLIGTPTFGKGVVQSSVRLNRTDGDDGTGGHLTFTVAQLSTASGSLLNDGVRPDILLRDPRLHVEEAACRLSALINMSN